MKKRIDITISETTLNLMKEVVREPRSRFIEKAILEYIKHIKRKELYERLKEGYKASTKEAEEVAKEWEQVDIEEWDNID